MDSLTRSLTLYSLTYETYIVIGDFNVEVDDIVISDFCNTFDVIQPKCYKNPEKPLCIDLILTKKHHNSFVIETVHQSKCKVTAETETRVGQSYDIYKQNCLERNYEKN